MPTNPTITSGQKRVTAEKPTPVNAINPHDASSTDRAPSRARPQPRPQCERRRAEQRRGHDHADLERVEAEILEVASEQHAREPVGERADGSRDFEPASRRCSHGQPRTRRARARKFSSGYSGVQWVAGCASHCNISRRVVGPFGARRRREHAVVAQVRGRRSARVGERIARERAARRLRVEVEQLRRVEPEHLGLHRVGERGIAELVLELVRRS